MYTKTVLIFVFLFGNIVGFPLETAQYNVKNFLTSRIVGGQDAPEGFAKYMVALRTGYSVKFFVCGGSIISKRHILSAAHCIEPSVIWGVLSPNFEGAIGSNYWNSSNVVKFSGHKTHPGWDWGTLQNDIGILIAAKEIVFTDRIGRIGLNFNWIHGGAESLVTGWGFTGVMTEENDVVSVDTLPYRLQMLKVETITPTQCIIGIKIASLFLGSAPPIDPATQICTFHSKGHGMCNGNSGSALVDKHSFEQVGIVSWGFPCARGAPDVFSRISGFKIFLQQFISEYV